MSTMYVESVYDTKFERRTALAELSELQRQEGLILTHTFSEDDSLEEIRFEIKKQIAFIERRKTVTFMKDMIKMGCHGLELFNSKMGPFLELDGWAQEACSDMNKYDSALTRLHKKYCRTSTVAPEMELIMGLGMSVGMYHFKQKMLPTISGLTSNSAPFSDINVTTAPPERERETMPRRSAVPAMKRAPMKRPSPSPPSSPSVSIL